MDIWENLWILRICLILLFWQVLRYFWVSIFNTVVSRPYVNWDKFYIFIFYISIVLISACFFWCMYFTYKRSVCMRKTCAYKQTFTVIKRDSFLHPNFYIVTIRQNPVYVKTIVIKVSYQASCCIKKKLIGHS